MTTQTRRRPVPKKPARAAKQNQRRDRQSLGEVLRGANRRAHEHANLRMNRPHWKSVKAMTAPAYDHADEGSEWRIRVPRWVFALFLLPICWVTSWTFLYRFKDTLDHGLSQSASFWYFIIGAVMMIGWFASGIGKSCFLFLYVLGHELTHALFVLCFRGRVMNFHVSASGGYITTNKSNLLIALSPYFVPFWSVVMASIYGCLRFSVELHPAWHLVFYAVMGVTWTFHMVWTLWMLPRDQPDLDENGRLLSLVLIYLGNLVVLIALLCVAHDSPFASAVAFGAEWLQFAKQSLNQTNRLLQVAYQLWERGI